MRLQKSTFACGQKGLRALPALDPARLEITTTPFFSLGNHKVTRVRVHTTDPHGLDDSAPPVNFCATSSDVFVRALTPEQVLSPSISIYITSTGIPCVLCSSARGHDSQLSLLCALRG